MLDQIEQYWFEQRGSDIDRQRSAARQILSEICDRYAGQQYYDTRTGRFWPEAQAQVLITFCGFGAPVLYWLTYSTPHDTKVWRSDTEEWLA